MIHREQREETIVVKEHEEVVGVTCDLCRKRFAEARPESGSDILWSAHGSDERLVTAMKYHKTEYYGAECDGEDIDVHICPRCFSERLIPWMKSSQGVNVDSTIRRYGW